MFGIGAHSFIDSTGIYYLYTNAIILIILAVCSTPIVKRVLDKLAGINKLRFINPALITYMIILFLTTAYLVNETYNPFLYFRF